MSQFVYQSHNEREIMSEVMLETKDVAKCLGLSVRRVRKLLSSQKLRHVRIGRQFFIPEEALQEFLLLHMVMPKFIEKLELD